MKQRKSQPKNNPYYIRKVSGGLNGAVAGQPLISTANVLCNCVGYANGRFNEIINDPDLKGISKTFKYQLVCNAENFIESAKNQGLEISKKPVVGGIMVWQKGKTLNSYDGAGHVEVVEAVNDDGSIKCSSSGWNGWAFRSITRTNKNGNWGQVSPYKYRGCIVNPSVKATATKRAVPKKKEKWRITRSKGLYLYSKPSKSGKKLMRLSKGIVSTIHDVKVGKTSCFAKVKKDGQWGWILIYDRNGIYCAEKSKETMADKIVDACKTQAEWMKNFTYKWESNPTIEKSKKRGTCVTFTACVLQRVGLVKSGKYIWHNGRGYGSGKVYGDTSKMNVIYMGNKTFAKLKSKLQKGDVVLCDDNRSGEEGNGGHVMIFSGKWTRDGNPMVYDQNSATYAKNGKSLLRVYSKSRKILAICRAK